jgi:hypothetical protein
VVSCQVIHFLLELRLHGLADRFSLTILFGVNSPFVLEYIAPLIVCIFHSFTMHDDDYDDYRLLEEQNRETGRKLGIATACMFTLPILSFYISLAIFKDKQDPNNWAGGIAILVTNLIVGSYCYSAYCEDDSIPNDRDRSKAATGPKVGFYKKERSD